MQLFTGKHVAVLNVVEKLTRQTCRKKSGVFSLPFPPGGANSGVAILFAVNTVSSINAKVLTVQELGVQHEQRRSCSLLLFPSVYLYFFSHKNVYFV